MLAANGPEHAPTAVVAELSRRASAGWAKVETDRFTADCALAFRPFPFPAQNLLIAGDSRLAIELQLLLDSGAAPGWKLLPTAPTRTPLRDLASLFHRVAGSVRYCNLLLRTGFR